MSYILDALRRAEAERERERGQVPGLHSQAPMAAGDDGRAPSSIAPWVAAAVLAGAGVSGAWWWFSSQAPAVVAVAPPPVAPVAPAPAAPPAPAPTIAPIPAPPPTAAPAPVLAAPVVPAPPPSPSPSPRPARTREAAPGPAPAAAPPAAEAPASATAPSPAAAAVIAFDQLPEDVRRQLPPVAIGGAIYSEVPSARMLIVAGQLMREGDAIAAGVTLEQIRPRSAILRWKALRYEVPF